MTALEFLALGPLLVLTCGILLLMMVIAFARSLFVATLVGSLTLGATLLTTAWVAQALPGSVVVTPLITIDGFALLLGAFMASAALVVTVLGYDYLHDRGELQEEFSLLVLLALLGGMTLAASTHVASFALSLELLGVSVYALISYPAAGRSPLEAALKYLVLSGVSSAFILFGAALLYAELGTMSFEGIAQGIASADDGSASGLVMAGTALFLAGVAFKLSLVPFHMWTPDVYEGAPAPVTGFLATISKGAVFAVLLRLFLPAGDFAGGALFWGFWIVAMASMIVGNLLALLQTNVKRVLAYSSVAHLGYLLIAFLAGGMAGGKALAIEASLFYLAAYFVTTLGAFGVLTLVSVGHPEGDVEELEHYSGLFWRRPLLATTFTAMLLSLAGIPLTAGFIAKFYLIAAGVESGLWWLLGALVVGSALGLWYYLRIILTMTQTGIDAGGITPPTNRIAAVGVPGGTPAAGTTVMVLLCVALIVMGVYPTPLIDLINAVAGSVNWI